MKSLRRSGIRTERQTKQDCCYNGSQTSTSAFCYTRSTLNESGGGGSSQIPHQRKLQSHRKAVRHGCEEARRVSQHICLGSINQPIRVPNVSNRSTNRNANTTARKSARKQIFEKSSFIKVGAMLLMPKPAGKIREHAVESRALDSADTDLSAGRSYQVPMSNRDLPRECCPLHFLLPEYQ